MWKNTTIRGGKKTYYENEMEDVKKTIVASLINNIKLKTVMEKDAFK